MSLVTVWVSALLHSRKFFTCSSTFSLVVQCECNNDQRNKDVFPPLLGVTFLSGCTVLVWGRQKVFLPAVGIVGKCSRTSDRSAGHQPWWRFALVSPCCFASAVKLFSVQCFDKDSKPTNPAERVGFVRPQGPLNCNTCDAPVTRATWHYRLEISFALLNIWRIVFSFSDIPFLSLLVFFLTQQIYYCRKIKQKQGQVTTVGDRKFSTDFPV